MNRRIFTSSLLTASAGLAFSAPTDVPKKRRILPAHLNPGDQVGLISPASYIDDEGLEKAIEHLKSLDLKPVLGKNIRALYGSLAGTDEQRLADLHQMFADPQIKGIWCARGGYGCARFLPKLDYKMIRQNPKVFIGYSDITALHLALERHTGLVTFHGPVGSSPLTDYTRSQVKTLLFTPFEQHKIELAPKQAEQALENAAFKTTVIRPGRAEGTLTGGNLSLLASVVGTDYAPQLKNKILFLEDVGEKPYRIDRMLTTLRQAWPMEELAGIALGVFSDCEAKEGSRSLSLLQTLEDRLGDLAMPIIYGLSFGHIDEMCTLPLGIRARLDTETASLTLLEGCTL
jgi:muramoyltetrapeptide carboxypeptidase